MASRPGTRGGGRGVGSAVSEGGWGVGGVPELCQCRGTSGHIGQEQRIRFSRHLPGSHARACSLQARTSEPRDGLAILGWAGRPCPRRPRRTARRVGCWGHHGRRGGAGAPGARLPEPDPVPVSHPGRARSDCRSRSWEGRPSLWTRIPSALGPLRPASAFRSFRGMETRPTGRCAGSERPRAPGRARSREGPGRSSAAAASCPPRARPSDTWGGLAVHDPRGFGGKLLPCLVWTAAPGPQGGPTAPGLVHGGVVPGLPGLACVVPSAYSGASSGRGGGHSTRAEPPVP